MLLWSTLYFIGFILASLGQEVPSVVLTPEVKNYLQNVVANSSIQGLTLSIAWKNGSSEIGTWGRMTEDGAPVHDRVNSTILCSVFLELMQSRPGFILRRVQKPLHPPLMVS